MLLKEEILVVPTNIVNKTIELSNGFTPYKLKKKEKIYNIWSDSRFYIPKEEAEQSIVVDQLMPFIILKNEFKEYFILSKKDKFYKDYNIEKTNKNKRSLGTSKHICKSEAGYNDPLFKVALNIVVEDYKVQNIIKPLRFIGFNKNYLEKNNNHLGYVLVLDCIKRDIKKIDEEYYNSSWMSRNELIDKYGQFDMWSKYIIDYMVDNEV